MNHYKELQHLENDTFTIGIDRGANQRSSSRLATIQCKQMRNSNRKSINLWARLHKVNQICSVLCVFLLFICYIAVWSVGAIIVVGIVMVVAVTIDCVRSYAQSINHWIIRDCRFEFGRLENASVRWLSEWDSDESERAAKCNEMQIPQRLSNVCHQFIGALKTDNVIEFEGRPGHKCQWCGVSIHSSTEQSIPATH